MSDLHDPHHLPEGEERPPPGVKVMAVLRWALLAAMGLAAAYTLSLAVMPGRPQAQVAGPQPDAGQAQAALEAEHVRYHCPMHPQVVSDEPGTCPICGMKLVPIPGTGPKAPQADCGAGLAGLVPVDLPVESLQQLGVRIDVARTESLSHNLRAFGRITADESRLTRVHFRISGYVERLFVSTQGARVREGEPLAAIYSDELLRLQQELLQAKRWGGDTLTPVRERLKLLGVPEKEIAQVEASGEPLRALTLKSPASGYVTAIGVAQGDRIDPDRELFQISDLSQVWLIAEVPERDLGRVKEGLKATLTLDAYPGQTFTGRVDYLYPVLNTETRSLPVRVLFANKDGRLKPGLFGRAEFALPASSAVTVASEAVIDTGEHRYVFVEGRPGHYEPRAVTLGERTADRVQVLSGLAEGERVAASGNFFIDSESRLRASVAEAPPPATAAKAPPPPGSGPNCETDFDPKGQPDKYAQCKACERVHRGMGSMETDCKNAIPKPWRAP